MVKDADGVPPGLVYSNVIDAGIAYASNVEDFVGSASI